MSKITVDDYNMTTIEIYLDNHSKNNPADMIGFLAQKYGLSTNEPDPFGSNPEEFIVRRSSRFVIPYPIGGTDQLTGELVNRVKGHLVSVEYVQPGRTDNDLLRWFGIGVILGIVITIGVVALTKL